MIEIITLISGIFGLILVILVLLYLWIRPIHVDTKLPGPKRHPLFGVTFTDSDLFDSGETFSWDRWPTLSIRLSNRYNYQTWGGPSLNLGFGSAFFNVASPLCLEHILRDNFENYPKGKLTRSFHEMMGKDSSFTTDGEPWKFHRKVAVLLLNRETVMIGSILLQEKLQRAQHLFTKRIQEKKDNEKKEIVLDFQDFANRLIMDVFCDLGFGIELNSLQSNEHVPFVHAINEMQYLIHQRLNDLLWEIKQKCGLGQRERRIRELVRTIDEFCYKIIQDIKDHKKQQQEASGDKNETAVKKEDRQNIVSRYLDFCEKKHQPAPTNKELRDLIVGFAMAGRDSTAAGLAWTLYELTKHPTIIDRIIDEVQQNISGDQMLTMDHINAMPYLHSVVLEALRLHPPAPESFRFANKADFLPDGTTIPAGALIMFSTNTINHSPAIWDNPDVFDPDRFFHGKEPSPFAYATFIAGPRACPGRGLALMEIKMSLAFLLTRFTFEDASGHDGDYDWKLAMCMKGGFPVRIKLRNNNGISSNGGTL